MGRGHTWPSPLDTHTRVCPRPGKPSYRAEAILHCRSSDCENLKDSQKQPTAVLSFNLVPTARHIRLNLNKSPWKPAKSRDSPEPDGMPGGSSCIETWATCIHSSCCYDIQKHICILYCIIFYIYIYIHRQLCLHLVLYGHACMYVHALRYHVSLYYTCTRTYSYT